MSHMLSSITMTKCAGYLVLDPEIRSWLEKYGHYNLTNLQVPEYLEDVLKKEKIYPNQIHDIVPVDFKRQPALLLARVKRIGNNESTRVRETENDLEVKKKLKAISGLTDDKIVWMTYLW